ncbi:MAG: CvpA family protein [candidate division Zixibacteria bacterium]|nr:CvpA family protein [candidate division Zixibacteria bacterium]MCI0595088.1 CvpA family protein [candidate division Zixibacteria bacterium]
MNWLDFVLLALLVGSIALGVKRGLIREVMGFIGLIIGVVIAINKVDVVTAWVLAHMKASPVVVSFISFVLILVFFYLAFRLLGMLFSKALSLSSLGRIDQVGGGLVGFIRGWVLVGFVLFLLFYLPFPQRFYDSIENSFFAPALTGSVPMLYESTDFLHPQSPEFMPKIRTSLDPRRAARGNGSRRIEFGRDDGRYGERVSRVLANLEARYGENP